MIHYRLQCDRGDQFEAWFRDSAEYDIQAASGEIACPVCGSAAVEKALMAPAVRTARGKAKVPSEPVAGPAETVQLAAGPTDPMLAEALDYVRRVTKQLRENAEDVGRRFAEEARKIHHKEAPARNVIGEATLEEAQELAEEGIPFHPLPILPEDRH